MLTVPRTAARALPAVLAAAALLFSACRRESSSEIILEPPPTPLLTRQVIGYGVIWTSFTQVMAEPSQHSLSLGYLRKSAIVEVWERRFVTVNGTAEAWVFVAGTYRGWIREDIVQIYEQEAQARTAAEYLTP